MLSDLRYVLRSLLRNRVFTLVTIITLGIGIGGAGAVFGMVDWVLFRANPYADRLVTVGARMKSGDFMAIVLDAEYRALRDTPGVFEEIGLGARDIANIAVNGTPVDTFTVGVTPNLMPLFGVVPTLGRGFLPEEATPGRNDVVVISHHFWRQHLNGDEQVLGRTLTVGKSVCKIVGVLGQRQQMPSMLQSGVYRPLVYDADPARPWFPNLHMFATLRPGMTPAVAEKALSGAKIDLPPQMLAFMKDNQRAVMTMADHERTTRQGVFWVVLGAVGFLFAIACLNASNLMLLRTVGRQRELGIRLALGGGRWRVIRLFLIEALLVSLSGAALGLLVANWLMPLFMLRIGSNAPPTKFWHWWIGGRIGSVLGGLAVFTTFAILIVPVSRILRVDITSGLREGGNALGESPKLRRVRGVFVILQAAFAVILLTGTGLMVRSFERLAHLDLGFDATWRVKVGFTIPAKHLAAKEERLALLERIRDRLKQVPGVRDVAYGTDSVMSGFDFAGYEIQIPGRDNLKVSLQCTTPEYFATAGMRFLLGGPFERGKGLHQIVISESLARIRFGDANPIGQSILNKDDKKDSGGLLVVGVVADARHHLRQKAGHRIYVHEWMPESMNTLMVHATREPDVTLTSALKRAVYEVDSEIVAYQVVSMQEALVMQSWAEHFALQILRALSVMAVLLTVIGLLSVMAYSVHCRMNEFGVRLALGATPQDLRTLVIRRGMLLAGAGVVAGIAGGLGLTRFIRSLLYETSVTDPIVMGGVIAVLLIAAFIASAIPASRAAKVDVLRLLRAE